MTWQDFRIALRILFRSRRLAAGAITTLALAIGMTTSVFSIVNSVLLRPLPYRDADRLAVMWSMFSQNGRGPVSFDDFEDWRRDSKTLESAALYQTFFHPVLTGVGTSERLSCLLVSHGYFDVMKVKPRIGRFFLSEEDRDGRDDVVVLSYDYWRSRFQSDPGVIGRAVSLNYRPHTIVGVAGPDLLPLPRSLDHEPPQMYRPIGEPFGPGSRDGRHLLPIVRLRPGVTVHAAQADLDVRCRQMQREHEADANLGAGIEGLREDMTRNVRAPLLSLQAAVLILMLMACANIANLLLAKATGRQREMAIREALGAGMARLVRMLLTESLLLGGLGGLAGILLALWSTDAMTVFAARVLPDVGAVTLDGRVLVFALVLSLAAAILFGMAPVLRLRSTGIEEALKRSGRIAGDRHNGMRQFLAALQMALALVLLIATGLLGKSFLRLRQVNPGFDPQGVLTASVTLPSAKYRTEAATAQIVSRLLDNLAAVPGVRTAAAVSVVPMSGDFDTTAFVIQGRPAHAEERKSPDRYIVSPDYFQTLRIPLRQGRLLTVRDDAAHPPVCVISETAARQWFPGESPLGKKIRAGGVANFDHSPFREVVGVVSDVSQYGLGLAPTPQIYMPHAQFARRYMTLMVRTDGDPQAIAGSVRKAVSEADSEQPVYNLAPLEEIVANTMAARRLGVWLVASFGLAALLLAATGTYGVMSYSVACRTFEFGVRIAVGARSADVLRHAMADLLRMTIVGLASGVLVSLAASKLISGFLFGVTAADAGTYAAVTLFLAAVALTACYLPARRAARVDPITVLRFD
ncbi:MAG TPA: ABC transporter permease [Bryobacteraceae bacterium]|nr:ABC transporter permease [Bryobacteraceae bacterium]